MGASAVILSSAGSGSGFSRAGQAVINAADHVQVAKPTLPVSPLKPCLQGRSATEGSARDTCADVKYGVQYEVRQWCPRNPDVLKLLKQVRTESKEKADESVKGDDSNEENYTLTAKDPN